MGNSVPIQQQERIILLDIIRGIAILGILIVNMGMINSPYIYLELTKTEMWPGFIEQFTSGLIILFAQGKFYTMFSFLFGLGLVLFVERAALKNKHPNLLFMRRLLILFVFGLFHALFVWWGDILMMYAAGGFLLLAFYHLKPKTLLVWVFSLLSLYVVLVLLSVQMITSAEKFQPGSFTSESQQVFLTHQQEIESSLKAYGEGNFSEIMSQRFKDLKFVLSNALFSMFMIFPMFLLGMYAAKKKIFQDIPQHLGFIRKVGLGGLIIGLSLNILKLWSEQRIDPLLPSEYDIYQAMGIAIGDPAMCLFYIAVIIILFQRQTWKVILASFADVGRMAISNYLFQSLFLTTLYYSYGFGLYGQVGPAMGFILSITLFAFQLRISQLWFRKYNYGPVEWFWRTLTYGELQSFKK